MVQNAPGSRRSEPVLAAVDDLAGRWRGDRETVTRIAELHQAAAGTRLLDPQQHRVGLVGHIRVPAAGLVGDLHRALTIDRRRNALGGAGVRGELAEQLAECAQLAQAAEARSVGLYLQVLAV